MAEMFNTRFPILKYRHSGKMKGGCYGCEYCVCLCDDVVDCDCESCTKLTQDEHVERTIYDSIMAETVQSFSDDATYSNTELGDTRASKNRRGMAKDKDRYRRRKMYK